LHAYQDQDVLSPDQDAFGAALRDHLRQLAASPPLLLEFDSGIVTPALQPEWFFQPPSEWDEAERTALASVASGPVLDLGAGAGRHSLLMQELGLETTAIDISPGAVEVCHARGVLDARVGDISELPSDKRWGAVLLMCGNLGLAGGWDETRDLLARLAAMCANDAVVVADSVDPSDSPGELAADTERDVNQGVVTLRLKYGDVASPWTRLLNVPIVEVEPLVEGTGWRLDRHTRVEVEHYVVLRRGR
jgi:SAM-dependent methyltransferase